MKRFFALILVVLLVCPGFVLADMPDLSQMSDAELRELHDQINVELSTRTAGAEMALLSGDLGPYHVDVLAIDAMEDYQGTACLVVTYRYTNNSDAAATMLRSIDTKMFQGGVQLKNPTLIHGVNPNDMALEIKPGGSIVCQKGYTLNDAENAVDLELRLLFNQAADSAVLSLTYIIDK